MLSLEHKKYISIRGIKMLVKILHVETVPCVAGYVGVPVVRVDLYEFLHGAGLHGDLSHQLLGRQVTAGVADHGGPQHLRQVGGGHLGLFTLGHLQGGREEMENVTTETDSKALPSVGEA